MSEPLVSIIIPVYNQDKKLLDTCITSVIKQDYRKIECILIDDGSTDDTPQYCEDIAQRHNNITVIHKNNQRQGAARNAGLDKCTGDYVFFLDSDDWIEPETISVLVNLIKTHSADIAVCGCFKQTSVGVIHKDERLHPEQRILNNYDALHSYVFNTPYCTHSPCDKLYTRRLFTHARFIVGSYYEDLGSVYKFVEHAEKVVYTNRQLYCYYDNQNSTMHKPFSVHEFDKVRLYHQLSEYFRYKTVADKDYTSFVKEMDKETMGCAIGYISRAYETADKSVYHNSIEQTRQICKEIQSSIGWKLNAVRKLIIFSPALFAKAWKQISKLL